MVKYLGAAFTKSCWCHYSNQEACFRIIEFLLKKIKKKVVSRNMVELLMVANIHEAFNCFLSLIWERDFDYKEPFLSNGTLTISRNKNRERHQ